VKKIESVLLCSSALHLVTTKVISDHWANIDKRSRNVTVLIVHPLLSRPNKDEITRLSRQLFNTSPVDISSLFPDKSGTLHKSPAGYDKPIGRLKVARLNRSSRRRTGLLSRVTELVDRYRENSSRVQEAVRKYVPLIDEIYCPHRCGLVEQFFISALANSTPVDYFGIEDGIGDYGLPKWQQMFHDSKLLWHKVRQTVVRFLKFLGVVLISCDYQQSKAIFLGVRVPWRKTFPETAICGSPELIRRFREVIRKLRETSEEEFVPSVRILVLGSLTVSKKAEFTVDDEIKMYNDWVDNIVERHGINRDEIWYKPHPRLGNAAYLAKKDRLKCKIYPLGIQPLAEVEISRKGIEAVYSIGSTAILYAKVVFGKQAFLIDTSRIKKMNRRRSRFYRYIAKRYHIPMLDW
jgi:hypothetical protein